MVHIYKFDQWIVYGTIQEMGKCCRKSLGREEYSNGGEFQIIRSLKEFYIGLKSSQ